MNEPTLEDARADDPVERLLEESWESRSRRMGRRELLTETAATVLFLACSVPLFIAAIGAHHVDATAAGVLVGLYVVLSRLVKFPIGVGYVVPSYVALVPMLLVLPPGAVPLMAAGDLAAGAAVQWILRRGDPERIVFSI